MMLRFPLLYICLVFGGTRGFLFDQRNTGYRAAVYEHAVVTPVTNVSDHSQALQQMMVNLQEYEKQATIAGEQNVDIMVFPEYGIYGLVRDRAQMGHYVEDIPDIFPGDNWVPCDNPRRHPQRLDVVIFLSCLAKKNSLYIVANYGDSKPCIASDPNCPSDGRYQYNTNIAFDKQGTFIAKYHKQNLYYEHQFNEPINPEYVYFDTSFGRFGLFTCFDMLFHDPMIPLITTYNITDVAFPTAWMDALPYYSAIGYHSSVAPAYHVNVLAANIHQPMNRFQGSGIYTPNGANDFYYNKSSPFGQLMISDVTKIRNYAGTLPLTGSQRLEVPIPSKQVQVPEKSVVHHDWYDTVLLNDSTTNITVCQKGLCCSLQYQLHSHLNDQYAFGVFNGKHIKGERSYYLQVCLLFKCESADINSCGRLVFNANTTFKSLTMAGSFETPYVTPQIVLTNNGSLRLPQKGTMQFADGQLTGSDNSFPLLEACLFGRFYSRD